MYEAMYILLNFLHQIRKNKMQPSFADGVTFIATFVAALTGIVNFAILVRGKRDRYKVRPCSLFSFICQQRIMSVVSMSDHKISIVDYGFINEDGTLDSIPYTGEIDTPEALDMFIHGNNIGMQYNDYFESGYNKHDNSIGAYAISATQRYPRLAFSRGSSYLARLKVKARVFLDYTWPM